MNSAGVIIHKMQMTGDIRQKNAFLHSMDNQHWLGEDDQRIVFIRKISVSGYWWELAQKISQESNDQVSRIGNQKNYADQQLVAFRNYSQLAAQAIADLLAGNSPWYLTRWLQQENLPADPVAILQHKIYELPAVLDNLKQANQLSVLFSRINAASLQTLISSLAVISPVLSSHTIDFSDADKNKISKIKITQSAQLWIQQYLMKLLPENSSEQYVLSILKLVSCLGAWKFAPQLLKDVDGFYEWHYAVVQVYRAILHPTLTLPLARGGDRSHSVANRESSPSPLPRGRLGGGETLDAENIPDNEIDIAEENFPTFLIHQAGLFFLLNLLKSEKAPLSLALSHEGRGDSPYSASSDGSNSSSLLLNTESNVSQVQSLDANVKFDQCQVPLSLDGTTTWMQEVGQCRELLPRGAGERVTEVSKSINPWILIHQLFQKFAKEFSFSLDSALLNLSIEISHLTPEEFHEGLLVENPIVEQWFLHLNQKLQKMNLWNSDWFQLAARVEVDQAYTHIYLDNSSVQLDLRMAGLDVNPGWVPWLGRVIYFHYGNYPELRAD